MLKISELYVYPVKSLGRIELQSATLSETGFEYDRYWMLADKNGKHITQREEPKLALFQVALSQDSLLVTYKESSINIQLENPTLKEPILVSVFKEKVEAIKEEQVVNDWFSDRLGKEVYLVRQLSTAKRWVKQNNDARILFQDGAQYLIVGDSSLDDLNSKLPSPIKMNRFRPNIVFTGGSPFIEDQWKKIRINDSTFEITKSCARCTVTTVNQETGEKGEEPLKTLSQYRLSERKIWFGRYLKLVDSKDFTIAVGDEINVM
ncbi:MOSC domain-containing protein [Aquimarina sp. Aq78]|uniref:MOSC domain-containing protein n=1 Tax=Aquimarina sp. Aq78 TaxID=1191889 RepID=UPI000D104AC3|nr:MOSC N-terminal beta barrel domain-containing protein [Aquimarina sp. Aq78]